MKTTLLSRLGMSKHWLRVTVLGIAIFASAVPATGQGTLEGLRAYHRKDFGTAAKFLGPAAESGDEVAQFTMAVLYLDGLGTRENLVEGVRMARRAAEQGHRGAQYILGSLYVAGKGVPQNYVLAHQWLNLAAAQSGDNAERAAAVRRRDVIASQMTPSQLQEAQRRAVEWRPKKEKRS